MNKSLLRKLFPLGIVFLVIVFAMPGNSKFPYDYRKGREWKYETLFAEFDFPIYKTAEQMREERNSMSQTVIPYYKYSDEAATEVFSSAAALPLGRVSGATLSSLRSVYSTGVIADESRRQRNDPAGDSEVIYLQKDKRAYKIPKTEVYGQADAKAKVLADVRPLTSLNVDSLFRATGLYDLIVPNVLYDEQTTELVHEESSEEISPTSGYVTAGQLIVSEGELVTADIEQMLDSYKAEYEQNVGYSGSPLLSLLGNIIVAAALVVLLYFIIYFCCPAVFADTRYYYVLTLFTLSSVATLLLSSFAENLLFFVPYTLFAIMYQAFMPPKDIAPIYIVSLSPLLMSSHSGPMLFFIFAVSGLVMIFIFKYFQQGWKQFIASVLNFAMVAAMYLGFLASGLIPSGDWGSVLGLLVGSVFTVAGYPLVYLFERIFNMVSNSRLLELCDTSNPLIRTLEQKAPGTFQHSLQVMNMADAVARSVGVNPDLVRAGALYHDIGKMLNPLCFIENEFVVKDGAHYHDGLTPQQSAHDILRHVPDGVEIAQKHRLPKVIIGFISSHHGTTVVRYFYEKFLSGGGDPAQIGDFRYDGRKPRDKAQIVLMLCDSVEAASRTLKGNSEKIYSDFVESIVDGKMSEGQFDDADITIRELNAAKQTLKEYLAQLNHERIVYPKKKSNNK